MWSGDVKYSKLGGFRQPLHYRKHILGNTREREIKLRGQKTWRFSGHLSGLLRLLNMSICILYRPTSVYVLKLPLGVFGVFQNDQKLGQDD